MTKGMCRQSTDPDTTYDHASKTTVEGHVVGLLDRDRRTALSRRKFDGMRAVLVSHPPSHPCSCGRRTMHWRHLQPQLSRAKCQPKHSCENKCHLRRMIHRFSKFLVVCVCFLTVIRIPTVMSAPASRHGSVDYDERMHSHPKWINPCGLRASDDFDSELEGVPQLNDNELLSSIIVAAKNALMHAQRFKENYVKSTFNLNFEQIHQDWKAVRYEWLPTTDEIPKTLGEHVPLGELQKLELDMALKDTYTYLQKFAVGMEQVVWDQIDNNGAFKNEFADIEFKLRATLCEIQAAMLERGVTMHDDITRQIMGSELRHIGNSSFRNVRDWIVFRDCMNGLEYVIQVFEYFKQKLMAP